MLKSSAKINDGVGVKLNVGIVFPSVSCSLSIMSASAAASASMSRGAVVGVKNMFCVFRDKYA